MKKCPYCAATIQDEAILCRYCGRELQEGPSVPRPEQALGLSVQARYEGFLATLGHAKPERLSTYPLSPNRRANVIAEIVEAVERIESKGPPVFPHLDRMNMWWRYSATDKPNKALAYDWHDLAQKLLSISPTDGSFPTEDEWLSAVAALLVRALVGGRHLLGGVNDFIRPWEMMQKAARADRFIRGFFLLGAVANILSAPTKLPKEGSLEWIIWRRACAQNEAMTLFRAT